ncbi:MAG TPA: HEPN domain-containing protein [bacterium]|nr:HEPN domain-containing protein [bacterium]
MSDEAISLARWRLESAKARLAEARNSLKTRGYPGAINRAYYAIFTALRALLALKRIDSKTHQAAFLLFQKHYVKTGLFPRELAELAKRAKGIREAADYDDYIEVAADDARREMNAAAKFIAAVEKLMEAGKDVEREGGKKTKR